MLQQQAERQGEDIVSPTEYCGAKLKRAVDSMNLATDHQLAAGNLNRENGDWWGLRKME